MLLKDNALVGVYNFTHDVSVLSVSSKYLDSTVSVVL